jgi:hypothetical protein
VLVPLLREISMAELATVLPGATELVTRGEVNEDGLAVLRIEKVLDIHGEVLFDINIGHESRAVEDQVDAVGSEYLDQLVDLTGDEYFGERRW